MDYQLPIALSIVALSLWIVARPWITGKKRQGSCGGCRQCPNSMEPTKPSAELTQIQIPDRVSQAK
ncbi:MAG: hypothetical protein ACK56G_03545 [Pirellulaceae bacterium]|jgi:hypothetical protein